MFEKINYLALILLIAILAFIMLKDGKANWRIAAGRDFYAMAAQANVSEEEKKARIKEKYGRIEELIGGNRLEEALLTLKQIEPGSKTDAHLYFLQGKVYAKMKLYKESIEKFLKAVKYDSDYIDEDCTLYKGILIKEVTLDAIDYYKDREDKASREAIKLVYAMQRRLAGSCE
jgi:tetratricopeptide (TPR) repeat protein